MVLSHLSGHIYLVGYVDQVSDRIFLLQSAPSETSLSPKDNNAILPTVFYQLLEVTRTIDNMRKMKKSMFLNQGWYFKIR